MTTIARTRRGAFAMGLTSTILCGSAALAGAYMPPTVGRPASTAAKSARSGLIVADGEFDASLMLGQGQKFGPTAPAHPAEKCAHPWWRPTALHGCRTNPVSPNARSHPCLLGPPFEQAVDQSRDAGGGAAHQGELGFAA